MMLHFLKSMIHNSIASNENHITFASEKKDKCNYHRLLGY